MPTAHPNLLVLLCDQLQRTALSLYAGPTPTPTWERLAGRGVVFDRAYCATPLCVPTRPSMMNGRWPHAHGSVCFGEGFDALHPGEELLIDRCQDAGYRIAYDGIWHINRQPEDDRSAQYDLFNSGSFPYADHVEMLVAQGGRAGEQQAAVRTPTDAGGHHDWTFSIPVPAVWTRSLAEHPDMRRAQRVADFIRATPPGRPFAAWCALAAPHPPLLVPEPYFSLFSPDDMTPPPGWGEAMDDLPLAVREGPGAQSVRGWTWEQWARAIAAYLGYVAFADACLGMVLEAVEASGRLGETVVLASCDHGEMLGSHNLYQKGVMYERSIGVPLVLCAPGVPPGRRGQLVSQVDYAPTVLELLSLPPLPHAQGQSLVPLLRHTGLPGREFIGSEFNGCLYGGVHSRAVMSRRYKYVYHHRDREQLFDLERDPGELHNLADRPEYRDVKSVHRQRLVRWMTETGDTLRPEFG
jgi:arylsulfatase A-like enzyme